MQSRFMIDNVCGVCLLLVFLVFCRYRIYGMAGTSFGRGEIVLYITVAQHGIVQEIIVVLHAGDGRYGIDVFRRKRRGIPMLAVKRSAYYGEKACEYGGYGQAFP